MAQLSLVDRFTFGQVSYDYPNAPGATERERVVNELLTAGPNRQRAVIALAEYQLQAQERQATMLSASTAAGAQLVTKEISQQADMLSATTVAGAQLVANEISQQTDQLRNTMESVRATLSEDIVLAGAEISSAINEVGTLLTMELAEVQWQLAQQNETLDKILHVLQENRSNETRQLVTQGIRLYNAGQYDKAEERFRRALDYDMTDYQVLMNLGFIEIHKNNADSALQFFQEALTLPPNLDMASKARAIWNLALLEAAQGRYENAVRLGDRSMEGDKCNSAHLYSTAIWAALVGNADDSLSRLRKAIETTPSLLAKAEVDSGFTIIRQKVTGLLVAMSNSAFEKARQLASTAKTHTSNFSRNSGRSNYMQQLNRIRSTMNTLDELMVRPSYSRCIEYARKVSQAIPEISQVADIVVNIDAIAAQHDISSRNAETLRASYGNTKANCQGIPDYVNAPPTGTDRFLQWGCAFPLVAVGGLSVLTCLFGMAPPGAESSNFILGLVFLVPGALLFLFYMKTNAQQRRLRQHHGIKQDMDNALAQLKNNDESLARLTARLDAVCRALESI